MLVRQAQLALQELADCHVCPRTCGVNRLEDKTAGKVTADKYSEINRHLQTQEQREALQTA